MRILFTGLGNIAKRHISNIKSLDENICIAVWRQFAKQPGDDLINDKIDAFFFSSNEALIWQPDAVFITNPASLHAETFEIFAKSVKSMFIEKPLSDKIYDLEKFINLTEKYSIKIMVGYNFRFSRVLQMLKENLVSGAIGEPISIRAEAGQYLPSWRIGSDYRKGVSARKELGGGVLLELSHEFDYVRWLLGEIDTVYALSGKKSDLEIDVEDIAEISFKFKNGAFGNIHLDMIQHKTARNCKIIGTKGVLEADLIANSIFLHTSNGSKCLIEKQTIARNDMYIDEVRHFFSAIKYGGDLSPSLDDGIKALELVSAAKESSTKKCEIKL